MRKSSEKLVVRLFLLLFILAIFAWLIPSTVGFINLHESRVHELPGWLQETSAFSRAMVVLVTVQLPYVIIAFGLFMEFLNPSISLKYNRNQFLTAIAYILVLTGLFTIAFNILASSGNGVYDTMFYGLGFGILFLLTIKSYSVWMKVLLWARLIEVWGPLTGYVAIPAALGRYTGGAIGHFGSGIKGMLSSPFFLTDFTVQVVSVIGVMYLLSRAGFRWFWIISFSIGAIMTGLTLSYTMPSLF